MKRWTENPWRCFGLPARAGWLVTGVYGVAAVLVIASAVWGWKGDYATRPVDEVVSVFCLVFAAACAGKAARSAVGAENVLGLLSHGDPEVVAFATEWLRGAEGLAAVPPERWLAAADSASPGAPGWRMADGCMCSSRSHRLSSARSTPLPCSASTISGAP